MHDSQRNKDLAKIHIAKKQLGLDDDSYRAMLQMVAGVNSAAHLILLFHRGFDWLWIARPLEREVISN